MKKLFISALFLLLTSFAYSKERMIINAIPAKSYRVFISRTDSVYIDKELPRGNSVFDATHFLLLIKEYENKGWKVVNITPLSTGTERFSLISYTLEK